MHLLMLAGDKHMKKTKIKKPTASTPKFSTHEKASSSKPDQLSPIHRQGISNSRHAILSKALERYAIPFIRNVEVRLVRWQATF